MQIFSDQKSRKNNFFLASLYFSKNLIQRFHMKPNNFFCKFIPQNHKLFKELLYAKRITWEKSTETNLALLSFLEPELWLYKFQEKSKF